MEAVSFKDVHDALRKNNAVVLGMSTDPVKAQANFKAKNDLPFTLLCDTDHAVHEQYGTWVEKSNYGKTYMGTARTTFIIDPNGKISRVFENVKPQGHGEQVLEALTD